MVTYGDYFSRKTLHNCGVSPDEKLFKKDEMSYTGMRRMEEVLSEMSEIYQTLSRGYTKNTAGQSKGKFTDLQVERKIVAAFYDSGILNNTERDYFYSQTLQTVSDREQICVEEANMSAQTVKTQKVEVPIKTPVLRNIRP